MECLTVIERKNSLKEKLGLIDKGTAINRFYLSPNEHYFRLIPKKEHTPELIDYALEHDGRCIKDISKEALTHAMCKKAVAQSPSAIPYIPYDYVDEELYTIAVENDGEALQYIPLEYKTKELCEHAVKNKGKAIQYVPTKCLTTQMVHNVVKNDGSLLEYIPKSMIDMELIKEAIFDNAEAVKFIPHNYLNQTCINQLFVINYEIICYISSDFVTKEMYLNSFEYDKTIIKHIPDEYITYEMCLECIEELLCEKGNLTLNDLPNHFRNNRKFLDKIIEKCGVEYIMGWYKSQLYKSNEVNLLTDQSIRYLKRKAYSNPYYQTLLYPVKVSEDEETELAPSIHNEFKKHEISDKLIHSEKEIYYISDIHLEFQLQEVAKDAYYDDKVISNFIKKKLENISKVNANSDSTLLIAGDVSHSVELTRLFFHCLNKVWSGKVVYVLGNHELWDNHLDVEKDKVTSIEEIVDKYKTEMNDVNRDLKSIKILQNELYIEYKYSKFGINAKVLSEELLLTCNEDDLKDICEKCSLMILGGTGFSGNNPKFNAKNGLYRNAITTLEEDRAQSQRFYAVYKKLERCAKDKNLIVLTHMPLHDWCNEPYNKNWIYVHGHTHQNHTIQEDEIRVYADNQIGYKPTEWHLKNITFNRVYDPLEKYSDGIYLISKELYLEFNEGRGIKTNGCNKLGEIYALKKNNIYMFIFKNKNGLFMLNGGSIKRLEIDELNYYFDHMLTYYERLKFTAQSFYEMIHAISCEVKSFKGNGHIHGCIVDIDFYDHIFLNPYDNKITFYSAVDTSLSCTYPTLNIMLRKRGLNDMLDCYLDLSKKKQLPNLDNRDIKEYLNMEELEQEIQFVKSRTTQMYTTSIIMKKIQYLFDNNILRIWNDKLLEINDKKLLEKELLKL